MQVQPSLARWPCYMPHSCPTCPFSGRSHGSRPKAYSRGLNSISARSGASIQQQLQRARKRIDQASSLKPVASPAAATDNDIVKLDVGGQRIVTARSTLTQVSGSVLNEMFCRENAHRLQRSYEGAIFLDMDPGSFLLVLQFMRELKMRKGHADHSLSTFRQEDRAHLSLLLQHLRLLPRQTNAVGQLPAGGDASASNAQPVPPGWCSSAYAGSSRQQQQQQQGQGVQGDEERGTRAARQDQAAPKDTGRKQQQQQQHCAAGNSVRSRERQRSAVEPGAPGDSSSSAAVGATSSRSRAPVNVSGPQQERAASSSSPQRRKDDSSSNSRYTSITSSTGRQGRSPLDAPCHSHPITRTPATSQLYYIQAQSDPQRGMKISVYSEADLVNLAGTETFDIFVNVTASHAELSFTFVCRQDFDDVFLGITTRQHIDCRGCAVPCFGWKSNSRVYASPGEELGSTRSALPLADAGGSTAGGRRLGLPLWGRGDSVELVVLLGARGSDGGSSPAPCMVLKVNGRELDRIPHLPPLHAWSWYVALYVAGDPSCITFMDDSYAVFWGEYQVKRFLV